MSGCSYKASGELVCTESFSQPAFISQESKHQWWTERKELGFPMPTTEWQNKGHEVHAKVDGQQSTCPKESIPEYPIKSWGLWPYYQK